jgi:hypothetical protein
MKTLCILGIPNRHNIHNLKYSQNSTSAVPQVIVRNVPNVYNVPNQHRIFLTCSGWCTEQAMPNPTSPRVCQLPTGARACFAGLNKLFFGDLIYCESVYSAVLYRPQHRPGSPNQAQMWPYGSTNSIVPGTPAFAEIGSICFGLWCAKNGALNQFSHSLFIEIPSRDSLLARTEINTQDRQEAAVEAVSAVSACHCETVLDSTGYRCRPPGPLLPLQATVRDALRDALSAARRVRACAGSRSVLYSTFQTPPMHVQGYRKLCAGGRVWFYFLFKGGVVGGGLGCSPSHSDCCTLPANTVLVLIVS